MCKITSWMTKILETNHVHVLKMLQASTRFSKCFSPFTGHSFSHSQVPNKSSTSEFSKLSWREKYYTIFFLQRLLINSYLTKAFWSSNSGSDPVCFQWMAAAAPKYASPVASEPECQIRLRNAWAERRRETKVRRRIVIEERVKKQFPIFITHAPSAKKKLIWSNIIRKENLFAWYDAAVALYWFLY